MHRKPLSSSIFETIQTQSMIDMGMIKGKGKQHVTGAETSRAAKFFT
jgi:hypothetical protein